MKQVFVSTALYLLFPLSLTNCTDKDKVQSAAGMVTGKISSNAGTVLTGVKTTIEHTVWYDTYVFAVTNSNGEYSAQLPAEPAGSWTAKAQLERSAWGQAYKFDLLPDNTGAFSGTAASVRNFTWKLSGQRVGATGFYGAHVDLYAFGTDANPALVKLVFTPLENTLIDGSPAVSFERTIEDVAGTFMAKDIPIGKYNVKAVYAGKTLLLDNRHDNGAPAAEKVVVFGKYGTLGETEYNIEFWLSE